MTALLLFAPAMLLVAVALVPRKRAHTSSKAPQLGAKPLSNLLAAVLLGQVAISTSLLLVGWNPSLLLNSYNELLLRIDELVFADRLAGTMQVLVASIGFVVIQYSKRYLEGDPNQVRFIKSLSAIIGGVLVFTIADHLWVMWSGWLISGLMFHRCLIHFGERKEARAPATSFWMVSRLSDLLFAAAILISFGTFQAVSATELFQVLNGSAGLQSDDQLAMATIAGLLILAAAIKSVQLPFHGWLASSMESPTPASALLHAGVINGGGFLLLRFAPVLNESPWLQVGLAGWGSVTAGVAAVVMLTQSRVKQQLAYSTIAQFGLMMVQIGLGAYSAALLHLIAHSLYKSYAFLGSGQLMSRAGSVRSALVPRSNINQAGTLFGSLVAATVVVAICGIATGQMFWEKTGGVPLALIIILALTSLAWGNLAGKTWKQWPVVLTLMFSVTMLYIGGVSILGPTFSAPSTGPSSFSVSLAKSLVTLPAFGSLFVLHVLLSLGIRSRFLDGLQVHASNGFYLERLRAPSQRELVHQS